jgi:hypothetical protein
MIYIELMASLLTITTIYLLSHATWWNKYQIYGCVTGLAGQAFWLFIIFTQSLYGLLLADAVIFVLYVSRINALLREG